MHLHQRRRATDRSSEDCEFGGPRSIRRTPSVSADRSSWCAVRAHAQTIAVRRPRLARAVRRLEHHRLAGAEPQRRPARHTTRKRGGIGDADDVDGVGAILQAQGDAQVGVGPDLVVDDTCRPLRRQDEMDPEAAPALGDPDERRQEPRKVRREGGELVDHDDEARQRSVPGGGAIGVQIVGAGGSEQPLATPELSLQADQRPFGEPVVEVGDDADCVRQSAQASNVEPPL